MNASGLRSIASIVLSGASVTASLREAIDCSRANDRSESCELRARRKSGVWRVMAGNFDIQMVTVRGEDEPAEESGRGNGFRVAGDLSPGDCQPKTR